MSQVICNVILCTLAGGVFGGRSSFPYPIYKLLILEYTGWYYYGPRTPGGGVPKRASLMAFVRASTLSLGSIAFGSLLVTILELLRLILQLLSQYEAGQGDSMFPSPLLTNDLMRLALTRFQ